MLLMVTFALTYSVLLTLMSHTAWKSLLKYHFPLVETSIIQTFYSFFFHLSQHLKTYPGLKWLYFLILRVNDIFLNMLDSDFRKKDAWQPLHISSFRNRKRWKFNVICALHVFLKGLIIKKNKFFHNVML